MQQGQCVKCSSLEVYTAEGTGLHHGLTDASYLRIYKDQKWVPDVQILPLDYYVCQTCGYFEMYVHDVDRLAALTDSSNWRRVRGPAGEP